MSSTLFITGATSGFGEACARRFAEAGWSLVLTGRREERLQALAGELSAKTRVLPLTLDVRDRAAMSAAVDNLPEEFATLRGLINNAGRRWAPTRRSPATWTTGTPWSTPTSRACSTARACCCRG